MDRNSVIGMVLIGGLMMIYFQFMAPEPEPDQVKPKTEIVTPKQSTKIDSISIVQKESSYGEFANGLKGEEKTVKLENEDLSVELSTKGAFIKSALLKKFKTSSKQPLYLIKDGNSTQNWILPVGNSKIDLTDLFYTVNVSGSKAVFRYNLDSTKYVEQTYNLAEKGYKLDYDIKLVNVTNDDKSAVLTLEWKDNVLQSEADMQLSRTATSVNYYLSDNSFDKISETSMDDEKESPETDLKWFAFKSRYFLAGFVSDSILLKKPVLTSSVAKDDSVIVKTLSAKVEMPLVDVLAGKAVFSYYLGPNQFDIIKSVTTGFEENVYLGWPVINLVNKWAIYPIFNLLESFIGNYGIIIFLLVVIIRIFLFPLNYKSYISMAKIRVLKPEIDEIKERVGEDMAAQQQEQMKLYQSVGVNPLAGCLPLLMQMPILLAMFNLFPNAIELRQKSFLWADDLSTYDSIIDLSFSLPGYGSHVSLFTILMTASTILYTWYNSQMTASTMNKQMMMIQYIMPLVFMFVLNSLSAGLTYYYFVGNIIAMLQQFIIRKFVDEDVIRRKLDEFKKTVGTTGKKNRFMQRLEDSMKEQEERKKKK